jgi:hypothetical protein
MKHYYKTCALCRQPKTENRAPYCRPCGREYYRARKKSLDERPGINLVGLGKFIDKIKRQNMDIDFNDINNIIFFYQIISTDIHEYDNLPSGRQIKKFWDKILKYYTTGIENEIKKR